MIHLQSAHDVKGTSKVTISVSFDGFEFDYLSEHWTLNRNVTVFTGGLDNFQQPLQNDIREAIVYYAENYSANHTHNIVKILRCYLRKTGESQLSENGFISFKNLHEKKDWYRVSLLRGFIRQMRYLGLDKQIDDSVYKLTDSWKLGGNEKGVAVLSLDPESGPFSDQEFDAIGFNAAHRFAEGLLSIEEYSCITLFKATGRRPSQIASIKCKDFVYTSSYMDSSVYLVAIPKAKVRGGKFRSVLASFGLANYIGQVIEQHIQSQTSEVEYKLGRKLTDEERGELPLFLDRDAILEMRLMPAHNLLDYLKSELPHNKTNTLTSNLKKAVKKLGVISERTGLPIKVTGYRFRYTLGTRAAREGAGLITLATLLDHSDTQHVHIYVENIPEFAIEISNVMNQPLAKYASAFAGKIVENEAEANAELSGATRIPCREMDCEVGSCGTNSFCQDYAPIACYLCPKFRPWANAPHQLVLKWLMDERERLKGDTNNDMQVVSINDRAIVAVCQVIELCREYNNG